MFSGLMIPDNYKCLLSNQAGSSSNKTIWLWINDQKLNKYKGLHVALCWLSTEEVSQQLPHTDSTADYNENNLVLCLQAGLMF